MGAQDCRCRERLKLSEASTAALPRTAITAAIRCNKAIRVGMRSPKAAAECCHFRHATSKVQLLPAAQARLARIWRASVPVPAARPPQMACDRLPQPKAKATRAVTLSELQVPAPEYIPGPHGVVPAAGGQQALGGRKGQLGDRALMRCQHVQQAACPHSPHIDLEGVQRPGTHHLRQHDAVQPRHRENSGDWWLWGPVIEACRQLQCTVSAAALQGSEGLCACSARWAADAQAWKMFPGHGCEAVSSDSGGEPAACLC